MSLSKIDKNLTKQFNALQPEINSLSFKPAFEFELNENFDNDLYSNLTYKGIYLFEIQTKGDSYSEWVNEFLDKWEDKKYKYEFVPNSRKKRVNAHKELKKWFPIYLGRSKKISDRIKSHLHTKLKKPTGALKLLERENLFGEKFRVSTIHVPVENYSLIMPQVEKTFREKINPILGRQ